MAIISRTTWNKFTQEEKEKVREIREILKESDKPYILDSEGLDHKAQLSLLDNLFSEETLSKPLTYEEVAKELFMGKDCYYTDFGGAIRKTEADYKDYQSAGFCTSQKQAEKLLAINKLLNVAAYLNQGWNPKWELMLEWEEVWVIGLEEGEIQVSSVLKEDTHSDIVYFRTEGLANQAIQILGEDVIRLALGDY